MKHLFLFSLIFSIGLIQCSQEVPCDIEFQSFTEQQGSTTIIRKLYALCINEICNASQTEIIGSMTEEHHRQDEHGRKFVQTRDYRNEKILFLADIWNDPTISEPKTIFFNQYNIAKIDDIPLHSISDLEEISKIKKQLIKKNSKFHTLAHEPWQNQCVKFMIQFVEQEPKSGCVKLPMIDKITKEQSDCCPISNCCQIS